MNKNIFKIFFFLCCLIIKPAFANEIQNDELLDLLKNNNEITKPDTNLDYDYQSYEKVPITLRISEKITTKNSDIYDNQPLTFYATKDSKHKDKIIVKKGTEFTANIALYMGRGMNGIPAMIIIENFKTDGLDTKKIKGTYIKKGFNMTPFVLPIKWALTPIPGVGSLTNFILGGNAKINPNKDVVIYYYPNWK